MVDGMAIYTRALEDSEIYRHYQAGRRMLATRDIVGAFGGNSFDGTKRDILFVKEWAGRDWTDGTYTNVSFESGTLEPVDDPITLQSLAGSWTGIYEVATSDSNVYGVQVDWDGSGSYLVEASINDGSTWQTLVNGRLVLGTWNWSPTDKSVLIRVTFTGGVVDDISNVSRLRVAAFTSPYVYGTDSDRSIEILTTGVATNLDYNAPIENNFRAGIETYLNGSYSINPDVGTESPKPVRTLELWWKSNQDPVSAGRFIFDARPSGAADYLWTGAGKFSYPAGGTLYVNGVATPNATMAVVQDTWYHLVYVFGLDVSTRIDFTTSGWKQISITNTYPTALTASDAATMYNSYIGYPSALLATESSPVTEPATAYKMYAYDWSISPAG
jgi:hypothetical protein